MMSLTDALQETGCAICLSNLCVTSVERLTDTEFLLMTRRGVCILQWLIADMPGVVKRLSLPFEGMHWTPAEVQFLPRSAHDPLVRIMER